MKITILCSDTDHPVYPELASWAGRHRDEHDVELVTEAASLAGGDILFLISCNEIVNGDARGRYRAALVIHASDLPAGRGWSPLVWQILEGKNRITLTLLEAADRVDSGGIWAQRELVLEGHELCGEINDKLFRAELELMDFALENFASILPRSQDDRAPTYYRKRSPEDSRLDPDRTLAEQFDLLRIADDARFPAFFDLRGHRYYIHLRKDDKSPK